MNPIWVALVVALPSIAIAYFGYQRSKKVDAVAEQAGIEEHDIKGVDQVIEGLNKLVANLQQDNALLRENVRAVDEKLSVAINLIEELRLEIRELKNGLTTKEKA